MEGNDFGNLFTDASGQVSDQEKLPDLKSVILPKQETTKPEISLSSNNLTSLPQQRFYHSRFGRRPSTAPERGRSTRKSYQSNRLSKTNSQLSPISKSETNDSPPSESEVISSIDNFQDNGEPIDPQIKPYALQYLNRQRVNYLISSDYNDAKKMDEIINNIKNYDREETEAATRDLQQDVFYGKKMELQEQYDYMNSLWDEKIEHQKQEFESQMTNLKNKQLNEVQQFREKWSNPEFIESKCKASSTLLNLRYKETKLALLREYETAEQLRQQANLQQQHEEEEMKINLENEMRNEFMRMKEKHKKEEENAIEFQQKIMNTLETQKEQALSYYKTTDKPSILSRTTIQTISSSPSTIQSTSTTPRTANSLQSLRGGRKIKLNVQPMSDGDFERLEAMIEKQNHPKKIKRKKPQMKFSRRLLPAI